MPHSTLPRRTLFFTLALACLLVDPITGPAAIVLGMLTALTLGNPLSPAERSWNARLLGGAVALLGAGIPLRQVIDFGSRGLGVSLLLILGVLGIGVFLGRRFGVDEETAILISSGTAICGGSAIAATSGAISAKAEATAISLAVVFLLNATAVLIFPPLGHALALSSEQFGVWASLAIHDTSSVIGAALAFGEGSEAIATPMKLARALWIIPMAAGLGAWVTRRRSRDSALQAAAPKKPWFIAGFAALAAFFTAFPEFGAQGALLAHAGRRGLVLVLFLIGATLTRETLRKAGLRPFMLGSVLWALTSGFAFLLVRFSAQFG